MADENASRDDNAVPVGLGVTDDASLDTTQLRMDTITKRLLVDSVNEEAGHASIGSGSVSITAAGQVKQLDSQACKRVWIQAQEGNTGTVVVGGSDVAATLVVRTGRAFYPTQGDWFKVSNMNVLYVSSTVAGDSIGYIYEN